MLPTAGILILALALALAIAILWATRRARHIRRRRVTVEPAHHPFARKKPDWVRREIIRLRVLMPYASCRTIASTFNLRQNEQTVGKTYVANLIKAHAVEILRRRKELKKRKRGPGRPAETYALDFTFVHPELPPVLGVLDHGTRALLALQALPDRSAIAVLRVLLDVFDTYGKPRFLRSDNERTFTAWPIRLALLALGVRHRTTDPHSPWQNGRVERVFRTLKEKLRIWWEQEGRPDDSQPDLDTLRSWYNHARPHQSLGGLTPALVWAGRTRGRGTPRFFDAWDGTLAGFAFPT